MSYTEYNVGYRDSRGDLKLAFKTPTHRKQALKRLKSNPFGYEWQSDGRGVTTHKTFLVSREIPDWQEDSDDD